MKALTGLPLLCLLAPHFAAAQIPAQKPIVLQKPIDCEIGKTCQIQQYADHDPGPGAKDYRCGSRVYDHHDGTDFRIQDKVAQNRGISVLAAADGVVAATRFDMPDFAAGAFDATKIKGAECGNGVLIKHAGGWETQYCHMRQGSVAVGIGQAVKAGDYLGQVGQSGDAEFIHLHLTVRHNGKVVDPFAPDDMTSCHANASLDHSLWAPRARAEMAYKARAVLNMGFATRAVPIVDVENGGIATPRPDSPALVAYVLAIGLEAGDVQRLTVTGPDGAEIATGDIAALDHDNAQYEMYAGKKRHDAPWPAGTYTGHYSVLHDGKVVFEQTAAFKLN